MNFVKISSDKVILFVWV